MADFKEILFKVADSDGEPLNLNEPTSIAGTAISQSTDDGSASVKVGSVFNDPPPNYAAGDKVDLQVNNRGSLKVSVMGLNTEQATVGAPTDSMSATANRLNVASVLLGFTGSVLERLKSVGGSLSVFQSGGSYSRRNTVGNHQVKTGSGSVDRLIVGVSSSAAGSIILYDGTSTSGGVICAIDATKTGSYEIYAAFSSGLMVSIPSGVTVDLSVIYR